MAKLSRLGWIVAIIIALALSLYLSTMVFYTDTTLGNINMTIKCLILCGGGLGFFFVFVLLDTDACKSNYKLLMQLGFLHIIMQIVTIIFALIFSLIAEIDTGGLTGVILVCSIAILLSLLAILINTDWDKIKSKINLVHRKNHIVTFTRKVASKLIVIDGETNGETNGKIKWK